jgi:hypothetical protein
MRGLDLQFHELIVKKAKLKKYANGKTNFTTDFVLLE